MKRRAHGVVAALTIWGGLIGAQGCSSSDGNSDVVTVRAKPGVDFGMYQTFRLSSLDEQAIADAGVDPEAIPDDVKVNIEAANDQARIELLALGLTQADEGDDADLVVFSLGTTEENGGVYWDCVPGYWWGFWGWNWDPCAWLEPVYVDYTVGSMVIGLADPNAEAIVFGGLLQGVENGENVEQRIRNGVHAVFKQYPATK